MVRQHLHPRRPRAAAAVVPAWAAGALVAVVAVVALNAAAPSTTLLPVAVAAGSRAQAEALADQSRKAMSAGDLQSAVGLLEQALDVLPGDAYLMAELATTLAQGGFMERGIEVMTRAAQMAPPEVASQVAFNLGMMRQQTGDMRGALQAFEDAIAADPAFHPALMKAAFLYNELGDADKVIQYLSAALEARPGDIETMMRLGDTLNNRKRWEEAVQWYERAIAVQPRDPELRHRIGDTLLNLKRVNKALAQYSKGLKSAPKHAPLLASWQQATRQAARWNSAERDAARLLSVTEGQIAQRERQQASMTARALAGRPPLPPHMQEPPVPPSPLAPYAALFMQVPRDLRRRISETWADALSSQAFDAHGSGSRAPVWAQSESSSSPVSLRRRLAQAVPASRPLRLGYVSRRFEDYPGTQLMLAMFPTHDRARASVHCFASGPDDGSAERAALRRDCDTFADVSALPTAAAAREITGAGVDVLVDYDGMHEFNNVPLLALRPAPVQVTFLGFAGSIGSAAVADFIVVDDAVAPAETARGAFAEGLLYLPSSYQPQDPRRGGGGGGTVPADSTLAVMSHIRLPTAARAGDDSVPSAAAAVDAWWGATRASLRTSHNLTRSSSGANATVFACFNRAGKIDPQAWALWMRILRRVPGSVLWVYGSGGPAERRLRREAVAAGIPEATRVVFAGRVSKGEHLTRHYAADVFLDTLVYGAHTTASDAMYSGLPVVTLAGDAFPSRVAASLVRSLAGTSMSGVGHGGGGGDGGSGGADGGVSALAGLEATSLREYEDTAVRLGNDKPLMLSLRRRALAAFGAAPPDVAVARDSGDSGSECVVSAPQPRSRPGDVVTFVRGFERAVQAAVEQRAAGDAPWLRDQGGGGGGGVRRPHVIGHARSGARSVSCAASRAV